HRDQEWLSRFAQGRGIGRNPARGQHGKCTPAQGGGLVSRRHDAALLVCALIAALVFNYATGLAATAPAVASLATYRGADRDQLVLAGAKREGKVVFYSGMIENQALR